MRPHKVRPGLPASMPRLSLTAGKAHALATALVPAEAAPVTFSKAAIGRGAALFASKNCSACHAFGQSPATPRVYANATEPAATALALAPDLALTRKRFQSGTLVAWLQNPESISPGTAMPNLGLTEAEASSLAAFLWHSSEEPLKPKPVQRLAVLEREVGWDELFTKVFKTVCWHCHSAEAFALGDGGPGNTGGLGFVGKGFDVSSYDAIRSGVIGADGRRKSVFGLDSNGEPQLISVILTRQAEERGEIGELFGMPLGFPSMTPEQIQLVESTIAQGRPR